MSQTLFPFIAKVNAPRALFSPQIRYSKPPSQAMGLCAAVVRAGRNEQNPLLYNLAAGHYSDGGLPVKIKEFEPYAPFEPYESRMLHESQEELLSESNSDLKELPDGQEAAVDAKALASQAGALGSVTAPVPAPIPEVLDVDIDSILEGVRKGTISSVSPEIAPALVYFVPQKQDNKVDNSQTNKQEQSEANNLDAQRSGPQDTHGSQQGVSDVHNDAVVEKKRAPQSYISSEYKAVLTNSPDETIIANQYIKKELRPLTSKVKQMAYNLIGFSGMEAIRAHLCTSREEYLQQSNNGTKGIGLVIFDHLDPSYIDHICTHIYLHQKNNLKKMLLDLGESESSVDKQDLVVPSPFRTAKDKGLGRDFKRVQTFIKWINSVGEESYDVFDTVHLAIPRHTVKDLNSANSNFYVDRINRAIHWRDHNNDTGQIVLSGVNSDDIQSSMEGVPSIKNDDLIAIMIENIDNFFERNYENYGLKRYSCNSPKDPLKITLGLLHTNGDFSFSLFDLASYVALCWIYYNEVEDMPQALGMAMPILSLPREDNLFKSPSAKSATEKRYSNILNNKAAYSLCYRNGFDLNGDELTTKSLLNNLYQNFTWPGKDDSLWPMGDSTVKDNKTIAPLVELNTYEICNIRNFLSIAPYRDSDQERFDRAYNSLCFIEWQNKLQKLFIAVSDSKNENKLLSELTREHIEQEQKNGVEPLSEEENEILPLCDKPNRMRTLQDLTALIGFYTNRQFVIQTSPSLNKAWEKILFAQERYESENFLLSLAQALLYIMKNVESKQKLSKVVLDLPLNFNDFTKVNINVLRSFSIYFGYSLKELIASSNGLFEITFASQSYLKQADEINPLLNFNAFYKVHKFKNTASTSKAATTLKFSLTPYYRDGTQGESLQLYWALSSEQFAFNIFKDASFIGKSDCFQCATYDRAVELQSSAITKLDVFKSSSFSFNHQSRDHAVFAIKTANTNNITKLLSLVITKAQNDLTATLNKFEQSEPLSQYQAYIKEVQECQKALATVDNELNKFKNDYLACLYKLLDCSLSSQKTSALVTNYSLLQNKLMSAPLGTSPFTRNYAKNLLELLVMIGMAYESTSLSNDLYKLLPRDTVVDPDTNVPSNYLTALATPFCVEGLHFLVVKNERLLKLMQGMLEGRTKLNNQNLYLEHLANEISYSDNSEHLIRFNHSTNRFDSLISYQNYLGYTLYQNANAYQERYSALLPQDFASSVALANKNLKSNAGYNNVIGQYQQDYLNEVGDYIEHYLKSRPYLMEQCTIMIYFCGVIDLIVAIYRYLEQNRALSKVKFNLLIVNCTLQESKLIYQIFEQEKAQRSKGNIDGSFIQRIVVSVLTTDNRWSANLDSHFSNYLNQEKLSFNQEDEAQNSTLGSEMDLQELSRIADITLMFHVFDANATCRFTNRNVNVPIVLNDGEYQPSLINCSNYQELLSADINNLGSSSFANNLGKYLVCPVMTVSRAQMQHSLYYLVKQDLELFNKANLNLTALLKDKLSNNSNTQSLSNNLESAVPLVGVPLFELALSDKDNGQKQAISSIIKQVHNRSDVVIYFDDLMCRLVLTQNNIDVVYYHKLRNFALNFMVASHSLEHQSSHHLEELLKLLKVTNDYQHACNKVRQDAIAISGSILLRAETKRIHVYEMMGLVLSKYLGNYIFSSLAQNFNGKGLLKTPTYVSLDDYCALFGKKNQLRADILGLQLYERTTQTQDQSAEANVSQVNNLPRRYVLTIVVIESKFFEKPNDKAASKSLSQTQASTQNFYNTLFPSDNAISDERKLWLSRIADMLLTNANFAHHLESSNNNNTGPLLKTSSTDFVRIQELLRNGHIDIVIKGVSLVYAHSNEDITYNKTQSSKKGRVLGPGINYELVSSYLAHSKDRYPVMQVKIYQQALFNIMRMYLNDSPDNALNYLIEHDHEHFITSYLQTLDTLTPSPSPSPDSGSGSGSGSGSDSGSSSEPKSDSGPDSGSSLSSGLQSGSNTSSGTDASASSANLEAPIMSTSFETEANNAIDSSSQELITETTNGEQETATAAKESKAAQAAPAPLAAVAPEVAIPSEVAVADEVPVVPEVAVTSEATATAATKKAKEAGAKADDNAKQEVPEDKHASASFTTRKLTKSKKLDDSDTKESQYFVSSTKPSTVCFVDDGAGALSTEQPLNSQDHGSEPSMEVDIEGSTLTEIMPLDDSLDNPFTKDMLLDDEVKAPVTSNSYSAMPSLDHSQSLGEDKLLADSAKEETYEVMEADKSANPELSGFWLEHPNMHSLVADNAEAINFNQPKTLSFVQESEQALLTGLTKLGLKPVLKSTKVTANGVIFSFEGNDRFETEMINKVRGKLLTTYGVNIYDVKPKARQIDLYVMNEDRISIPFLALLAKRQFNYDYYQVDGKKLRGYNTKLILGLGEETGEIVYLDYREENPHTLVAGTTGSGKSVLLNCMILDMALTNWPEELELILVDPKRGVEFGPFADLPHLANKGIIIEKDDAIAKLNELVDIMEHRSDLFTELTALIHATNPKSYVHIRDIDGYNQQCCSYGKERMKHIIFIMDEFADWFLDKQFKENAISCLQRLAQKGRFSGINVIFATQRPDSKLMDSNVKAQLGNRIALKTTDKTNSKIILDDSQLDASKLNGKGHMICKLSTVQYAQSGYISPTLVDSVISAINRDYQDHIKE